MAINKVQYGNTTLIDLTADTATAADLLSGVTAHDRSGTVITGTIEDGDLLAYGNIPNLRGTTWYFDDVPSYATSFTYETPTTDLFKNNYTIADWLRGIYFDSTNGTLKYGKYTGSPTLSKVNAYTNGSWTTYNRTITFADIDIVDSGLIAFIQANATEQTT